MPTYEYKCENCQHSLEAFQKITDEPLRTCPACGHAALKRLIGGGLATFNFKGHGFYITDYKKRSGCACPSETKKTCPAAQNGQSCCQD